MGRAHPQSVRARAHAAKPGIAAWRPCWGENRMWNGPGGWPSLAGVNVKSFLEQVAIGKRVFLRVRDWWRREIHFLVDNRVFVDVPQVLLGLGSDAFAKGKRRA